MGEELRKLAEENFCLKSLIKQSVDYMVGNVSLDDSPTLLSCEGWSKSNEDFALNFRNAIARAMEGVDDETKEGIKEELGWK